MKVHSSPLYSGIITQYRAMGYCKRRAKKTKNKKKEVNVNQNSLSDKDFIKKKKGIKNKNKKHKIIQKYTEKIPAGKPQLALGHSVNSWPQ